MSQVQALSDLGNIEDPTEFMRQASKLLTSIVDVVNGGLEFDKNLLSQTVDFTFTAVNTEFAVPHNLNRTGLNYIVVSKSAYCDVARVVNRDTKTAIYLIGSGIANVKLILF